MSQIEDEDLAEPEGEAQTQKERFSWDRIMAILALALSVTAIAVSFAEVSTVRAHSRATVWPHLSVSADALSGPYSIAVENKGVGPALIEDFAIYLDGALVNDMDAAMSDTLGAPVALGAELDKQNSMIGTVLAARETMTVFRAPGGKTGSNLSDAWRGKIDVRACYCSIQRDCWRVSLISGETLEAQSCAKRVDTQENGIRVRASDFEPILGDNWSGSLSYVDYGTGKMTSIPADAEVQSVTSRTIVYRLIYPKEPDYNSTERIRISRDGTRIDGEVVTSRQRLPDGRMQIITSSRGTDDNKPADIRYTYELGKSTFDVAKSVRYDDGEDWLERNRYRFTR